MRLLVIEDYQPLQNSVVRGLREAGYAVDATGDGEEGLWFATSAEYDVIVLDLMLPGLDGLTLLQRLRRRGHSAHVLVMTARDAVADRVRGLEQGADDYLVKPFAFAELLARVRALVRRKYGAKSPLIRVGDLEVDTCARTVRRAQQPVDLTAREFALLEFLALNQGRVISRAEIWEHLYDARAESTSNTIDVFVGTLRRKLEAGGGSRLIHTRRGMGYQLGETP